MPTTINFFDNYVLQALVEEIVPVPSFFKDRYFPTAAEDIFMSDKVLAEYQKGDRKMAPVVAQRVGDIPVERPGYELSELQPAYIALSRELTLDDLKKRGFGEALYHGDTPAQRAAKLQLKDLSDLDKLITRREEWMCVQAMINNGIEMQEMIDSKTEGETLTVRYYKGTSDHKFTVPAKWNAEGGKAFENIRAMCSLLSDRGLPAADLVLGSDASEFLLSMEQMQRRLDKNSGIITGQIEQELSPYAGVVYMGTVNFGGFKLNMISVDETYENDAGKTEHSTYAGPRVSKFVLDQDRDTRKLRLGTRPIAAPKSYCPYIYAPNVVG